MPLYYPSHPSLGPLTARAFCGAPVPYTLTPHAAAEIDRYLGPDDRAPWPTSLTDDDPTSDHSPTILPCPCGERVGDAGGRCAECRSDGDDK